MATSVAPTQVIGNMATSKIAAAMVAEVESDLPLLMHANKSVQKPFETAGDGTTMDVIVPEMPIVGDGAWINEGDPTEPGKKGHELDYSNKAVPVVLKQKHVAFGIPGALEFASIEDMENLVTKPYGSTLASEIQKDVAEAAMGGSAFTAVLEGAGKFPQVSEAIAMLRKARSYGKIYGVVGSTLNGKLAGEGIQYFNPQNNISDIWKSARLGEYNSAEWFTTPDVEDLIVPSGSGAVNSNVLGVDNTVQAISKGKKLFTSGVDGDYAWLCIGALDSDGNITQQLAYEGESIVIGSYDSDDDKVTATVTVADIFGNDTGAAYSFKILETKKDNGYLYGKVKNPGFGEAFNTVAGTINSTTGLDALKQTGPGVYYRGIIYAQNALCVAFGRFAKPVNAAVAQYSGQNGVTIRTTSQYQIEYDRNVTRWDTLVGANLARPNWAVELLVKA